MKNKGTDCPEQSVADVAKATKAPESAQRQGKGKPEVKTNVGCNLRELGHRSCYDAPTSNTNKTEMPSAYVALGALSMAAFKVALLDSLTDAVPP